MCQSSARKENAQVKLREESDGGDDGNIAPLHVRRPIHRILRIVLARPIHDVRVWYGFIGYDVRLTRRDAGMIACFEIQIFLC